MSKKLSKFLSKDILDEIEFAYERAEILITRSADLYNIYLTEVQNELNVIIKKLTSISFIFLPVTAIASCDLFLFTFEFSYSLCRNFPLIILGILLTVYLRKIGWL